MKKKWQVYYQNNGKGDKWIHRTFDTLRAADVCYQKRLDAYSEDGAFPDTDNLLIKEKPKKGDIVGFRISGSIYGGLTPRKWRMYWGLREIEYP